MNASASVGERAPLLYQRVAGRIREQILDGVYQPGAELPTEVAMAAMYYVSLETVRHALASLRLEGLIESRRGVRTRVCMPRKPTTIKLPTGALISVRMPTQAEKQEMNLAPTVVPIIVVRVKGQPDALYPGDTTILEC